MNWARNSSDSSGSAESSSAFGEECKKEETAEDHRRFLYGSFIGGGGVTAAFGTAAAPSAARRLLFPVHPTVLALPPAAPADSSDAMSDVEFAAVSPLGRDDWLHRDARRPAASVFHSSG
jgi:hypothetical protein